MPQPMVVRTVVVADADALAEVHWQTWRETYAGLVPEERLGAAALERRRGQWRSRIAEPRAGDVLRVGEVEGAVVGFAMAGPGRLDEGPAAYAAEEGDGFVGLPAGQELEALYVLAAHHGTGVGQALLDAVVAPGAAYLWVARDNPRARGFYRRNGFVEDGAEVVEQHLGGLLTIRMVREG